jgi:hypothetical protein
MARNAIPDSGPRRGSRGITRRAASQRASRLTGSLRAASVALLPGARRAALLQIWRAVRTLLTGRSGPGQAGEPEGWLSPWRLHRGEVALRRQEWQVALGKASNVLERQSDNQRALGLRAAAQGQAGALTAAALTIRAQRRLRDDAFLRRQEHALVRRLIETDPRWLPWVPGVARPADRPAPNTFVHVTSESMPLEGLGQGDGGPNTPPREPGLRSTTLTLPDPGPAEGSGAYASDHDLRLHAWRAARDLRSTRPSLIWATSIRPGRHEVMLVALALREHFRVPVVYEVRALMPASPPARRAVSPNSEEHERLLAQEARMLEAADAVVTTSDSVRDEIASRGVARAAIFLAGDGVDAATYQAVYDEVVAGVLANAVTD